LFAPPVSLAIRHCRSDSRKADAGFQQWVAGFYSTAAKSGISAGNLQRSISRRDRPRPTWCSKKHAIQPEFTTKVWDYLDSRVNPYTIAKGREMQARHAQTLQPSSASSGLTPSVLLAIWSMESNFGEILTKTDRLHYVPQALATLAYADRRRGKFARQQLVAALKILQSGDITTVK
jgi:membrane-bound lytic murein transglycosylase B